MSWFLAVRLWDLRAPARDETLSPALEGEVSMTGPPGKSPVWPQLNLLHLQRHYFQIRSHSEVLGHMNFGGILYNPVYGYTV